MNNLSQLLLFAVEGTELTPETKEFLKETRPGGVILFPRARVNPRRLADFISALQDVVEAPLIIGIDQEGGRVARLKAPFARIPPMARVGAVASRDLGLACEVGRVIGRELAAVGINVNFAPVLDVATNAFNPVIGDRAISPDPDVVAAVGIEIAKGLEAEGVAACGKHFPGHGDTDRDSHLGLPLLGHTRRRLEVCELKPFAAAIKSGIASIMTAHLQVPALDPRLPASVSRPITTGLLRRQLGFGGLVFTDDLTMKGIANLFPPHQAAWRAIAAGADVAVICGEDRAMQRKALDGIKRALHEGNLSPDHDSAALGRIAGFKARFCCRGSRRPPLSVISNLSI